jgi:hypothetical protein
MFNDINILKDIDMNHVILATFKKEKELHKEILFFNRKR